MENAIFSVCVCFFGLPLLVALKFGLRGRALTSVAAGSALVTVGVLYLLISPSYRRAREHYAAIKAAQRIGMITAPQPLRGPSASALPHEPGKQRHQP